MLSFFRILGQAEIRRNFRPITLAGGAPGPPDPLGRWGLRPQTPDGKILAEWVAGKNGLPLLRGPMETSFEVVTAKILPEILPNLMAKLGLPKIRQLSAELLTVIY